MTYQGFILDLLADELVLAQGVAGLSGDGVNGPLFHLLLDGAVQHEQGLAGTILRGGGGGGGEKYEKTNQR